MKNGKHILIAEDDANIRQGLIDTLESDGYTITATSNGEEALEQFAQGRFDMVLLDIMMPKKSGYDVCRTLRQVDEHTPVIMLTAKEDEIDKVVGLELGADDYITKPFGIRELLARIAAVLRRADRKRQAEEKTPSPLPEQFSFGKASIDRKKFSGSLDDRSFMLTSREMKLLEVFVTREGEVLSRDDLLNAAWGIDYLGTTRTLDQHIAQLRKKVETDVKNPSVIVTVHGIGYRYDGTT